MGACSSELGLKTLEIRDLHVSWILPGFCAAFLSF